MPYREIVTEWNSMESHDLFYEPPVSARKAGLLLSASHFSSIPGYALIKFVIQLSLIHVRFLRLPRGVRVIEASSSFHHPLVNFTPSEQLHKETSLK